MRCKHYTNGKMAFEREDSILAAGFPAAAALMSAGEVRAAKMQHL